MNQIQSELATVFDGSDCMGAYTKQDPQCAKHCALRLRCAIEKEYNLRLEIIEELVTSDSELGGKMQ
ncbi:MAG: hypothetical protein P8X96_15715 [Desulfobacteraceae bacterium]|jgi:hypothetical protein